jgi:hypothetical protein
MGEIVSPKIVWRVGGILCSRTDWMVFGTNSSNGQVTMADVDLKSATRLSTSFTLRNAA